MASHHILTGIKSFGSLMNVKAPLLTSHPIVFIEETKRNGVPKWQKI